MELPNACTASIRALLAEAAASRLRGDHGAAAALEADAIRALRVALAVDAAEVRA